jgi:DNA-binding NarL/FixJ family response regulator
VAETRFESPHHARHSGSVSLISVLICDAQPLMGDALALALERDAGLAIFPEHPAAGVDAVEAAVRLRPDVALIDFWLDGMEAPAVVREILAHAPETKILHLSWFHGPPQIRESIASGSVGFLPKGVTVAQVDEAIHRAHAGEVPVFEKELDELILRIERRGHYLEDLHDRFVTLSPRELQVLRLLGAGLTSEDIGARLGIVEATVRTHIHRILSKSGARSQLEAVALARDQGLVP